MLRPHVDGEIVVGDIGPVVGSHAGRGTIGVALHHARTWPLPGFGRTHTTSVRRADMPATIPRAASPPHAPCGRLLAQRYQLERRLAQGGMAEVWLATDIALDRTGRGQAAASRTLAADPVVAERFRREAIAVARLSHPNIVAVYDVVR